jgi:lipopolysaccharide export system protein LptA
VSRYGDVMTGKNALDDGKIYDVKKEIYRLTDRVYLLHWRNVMKLMQAELLRYLTNFTGGK